MHTPRAEPRHAVLLALVAAAATGVVLTTGGRSAGQPPAHAPAAFAWRGLVGSRPRVALGQRVIVVLRTPSLAQRVAAAGGIVDTRRERAWTGAARSAQRLLISRLALEGVTVRPDYTFTRVIDGFSAAVDPSAVPVLERDDNVVGVYPVDVAGYATRTGYTPTTSSPCPCSSPTTPPSGRPPPRRRTPRPAPPT